ncbi:unnamed protein product [Allacma fusca]|uniref:Uncharacterized protein n=1 Tax=Allacma fusca TaxID=39272 RepID=A0A8J2JCJ7_9HEXA|nr:unnamed protein product [Allacma fusca]
MLIFLIIPSGPNFLYYNVPENMKSPLALSAFAVLEMYLLTFWMSMGLFTVGTHVLTFHVVLTQLESGMRAIRNCLANTKSRECRRQTLAEEWTRCRKVQLNLRIFNESNQNLQCVQILFYFSEGIVLGYFGIRLILMDVVLGACFLGLSVISAGFYILTYEPAFGIPSKIDALKSKIRELACLCDKDRELAVALKRVNSVQCIGVKAGKVTVMHKLSPVIFVDFLVQNVLALLIAY